MRLGYNTNGLAFHELGDAIRLLADTGYRSVAITLDHHHLNPNDQSFAADLSSVRDLLAECQMTSVVETGARFLLDSRQKHAPSVFDSSESRRNIRIEFWKRAVDAAAELNSDCISVWSGVAENVTADSKDRHWDLLIQSLEPVLEYADTKNVAVGFEPEPGMFIDTMDSFAELLNRMPGTNLKLTLDVGHLHCLNEIPIAEVIHHWKDRLVNVHIEDMVQGVHNHLMFGDGEMEFPPIVNALQEIGYNGGVHVELSRHSHDGVNAVRQSFDFLDPLADWNIGNPEDIGTTV